MAIRCVITVDDWNTAKKYGCTLSYKDFRILYERNRAGLSNVVRAWCRNFMKRKDDD